MSLLVVVGRPDDDPVVLSVPLGRRRSEVALDQLESAEPVTDWPAIAAVCGPVFPTGYIVYWAKTDESDPVQVNRKVVS